MKIDDERESKKEKEKKELEEHKKQNSDKEEVERDLQTKRELTEKENEQIRNNWIAEQQQIKEEYERNRLQYNKKIREQKIAEVKQKNGIEYAAIYAENLRLKEENQALRDNVEYQKRKQAIAQDYCERNPDVKESLKVLEKINKETEMLTNEININQIGYKVAEDEYIKLSGTEYIQKQNLEQIAQQLKEERNLYDTYKDNIKKLNELEKKLKGSSFSEKREIKADIKKIQAEQNKIEEVWRVDYKCTNEHQFSDHVATVQAKKQELLNENNALNGRLHSLKDRMKLCKKQYQIFCEIKNNQTTDIQKVVALRTVGILSGDSDINKITPDQAKKIMAACEKIQKQNYSAISSQISTTESKIAQNVSQSQSM